MQAEMDNATQLLNSFVSGKATGIDASTKAKARLERVLGTVAASGTGASGAAVVFVARKLISDLNVTA